MSFSLLADTPNAVNGMLNAVTSGISTVISWIGTFITSLTSSNGALSQLLPLFAIGISISAILLGIKIVKSVVWGS